MKVKLVVEVDLEAMKAEDSLQNWCETMKADLGTDCSTWEEVAAAVAATWFSGGDYNDFASNGETEIEPKGWDKIEG